MIDDWPDKNLWLYIKLQKSKGPWLLQSSSPKPSGLEKHSTVEPACPAHAAINGGVAQSSSRGPSSDAGCWRGVWLEVSWFSDVFVVVSFNPMRNSIYIIIGNHLKYGSNQEFFKIFETSQSWNTSWWTVKFPIDGTGWWHYSDWGHRRIPETSVNFVSDVLSWIEMLRTVTVLRSGPRYLQQTQN
jgi:hypothetical protein